MIALIITAIAFFGWLVVKGLMPDPQRRCPEHPACQPQPTYINNVIHIVNNGESDNHGNTTQESSEVFGTNSRRF
jgi:hypothetical protein